jgi:hypothetical protein
MTRKEKKVNRYSSYTLPADPTDLIGINFRMVGDQAKVINYAKFVDCMFARFRSVVICFHLFRIGMASCPRSQTRILYCTSCLRAQLFSKST